MTSMDEDEPRPAAPAGRHGRLAWPRPDELTERQRAVYDAIAGGPRAAGRRLSPLTDDAGRLEGPFNAMLVSPPVGAALQSLGASLRYGTELSDRERELAILCVAAHGRTDFEWLAHERVARAAGLTDAHLDAALGGPVPDGLDAPEALVLEFVRALLTARDVDDELWERAAGGLGVVKVVELVTLVGYYQALELGLRVFRVPLPAGEHGRWEPPRS